MRQQQQQQQHLLPLPLHYCCCRVLLLLPLSTPPSCSGSSLCVRLGFDSDVLQWGLLLSLC